MHVSEKINFGPVTACRMGYAPLGKPLMSVICYYVDGALIDTGAANSIISFKKLTDHLPISQVILTHFHEDHSGNAQYLSGKRNIPIYAHPLTVDRLKNGFQIKPYEWYMWGKPKKVQALKIPETIETEHYHFDYLHTPGHAEDHLVYHEANEGWLFSGDMFLGPRIKYFRKDEDLNLTINSLKDILTLDFDCVFCGHNPKPVNGKAMIKRKLDYLEEFKDKIFSMLDRGHSRKDIWSFFHKKEDVFTKYFTMGDVSLKNMVFEAIRSYPASVEG